MNLIPLLFNLFLQPARDKAQGFLTYFQMGDRPGARLALQLPVLDKTTSCASKCPLDPFAPALERGSCRKSSSSSLEPLCSYEHRLCLSPSVSCISAFLPSLWKPLGMFTPVLTSSWNWQLNTELAWVLWETTDFWLAISSQQKWWFFYRRITNDR